jgi:hypothetical protein
MRQQVYQPAALKLVPCLRQTTFLRFEGSKEEPVEPDLHHVDCGHYDWITCLFFYRDDSHSAFKPLAAMILYENTGVRIQKKNNTRVVPAPVFSCFFASASGMTPIINPCP